MGKLGEENIRPGPLPVGGVARAASPLEDAINRKFGGWLTNSKYINALVRIMERRMNTERRKRFRCRLLSKTPLTETS